MKNYNEMMRDLQIIQHAMDEFGAMLDQIEENAEAAMQQKAA